MSALEEKAMLVRLATSMWTGQMIDARLSRSVTDHHNARKETARVTKQLIRPIAMKQVRLAVQQAKALNHDLTMQWDYGDRLLPVAQLETYKRKMDAAIALIGEKVNDLIAKYPDHVKQARDDLQGMFREEDYPSPEDLKTRFGASYEILPVPSATHFVADVGAEEAARIKAELERRVQIKLDAAMVSLYDTIETAVRKLIDRLGYDEEGNPKILHASAVENIQAIADAIPNMNLTDDPRLTEIRKRIDDALSNVSVEDLRYASKKVLQIEETTRRRRLLTQKLANMAETFFGAEDALKC